MSILENIARVKTEIAEAAKVAGKDPEEIQLIAVSKTVEPARILEAQEAGLTTFGENRVQEALGKQEVLEDLNWHLIGQLQTNKVRQVVGKFQLIHSLDRLRLAKELDRRSKEQGITTEVLVQVNVGEEESKGGVAPEDALAFIEELRSFKQLKVMGLMTIPPFFEDPQAARPYFAKLRELFQKVAAQGWPEVEMKWLSMGMSADFQVAIEEGANMVRVGTGIFGSRPR